MGGTLKDVASTAGVSLATASRVLSGSNYPVSEALRERVLAVATTLDYVPNAQARALIQGNQRTVGMLVGEVGDPYFDAMINGAHRVATQEACLVTILSTGRDPGRELESFRLLQSHGASIVIVAGSGLDDPEYRESLAARIRSFAGTTVLMGHHDLGGDAGAIRVAADNVEAGRLLGAHLAELGHRRVGVLSGLATVSSTGERIAGLSEGLGVGRGAELLVHEVQPTRDGGYSGARELLGEHPELTALVGTADQMAIGALAHCVEAGIEVPRDLSVAGFNDIWVSRDIRPALTTVHMPLTEMGAAAVHLALDTDGSGATSMDFPVELVVRDSTGPVREG